MTDDAWILGVRAAGVAQILTVVLATFTPIPARWDETLARIPAVHRRFAIAQNVFIGGVMVFGGIISALFAPVLISDASGSRIICAGIALWWGARLIVLPWLRVWPELSSFKLRTGFVLLHVECALFAVAYGWLSLRPPV